MPEPAADSIVLIDFDYLVKNALIQYPELAARIFLAEPDGDDTPRLQSEFARVLCAMAGFPQATKVEVVVGGVRPYSTQYAKKRTKGIRGGLVPKYDLCSHDYFLKLLSTSNTLFVMFRHYLFVYAI